MNYEVISQENGFPIKMWTRGVCVEDEAKEQLINVARMPFIHSHIAVMPDVHVGMGATIGSVIPTVGAIIPSAVGVDIGCGMKAVLTSLKAPDLPDNLQGIRSAFESAVPHGRTNNGGANDRGAWVDIPEAVAKAWNLELKDVFNAICEKNKRIKASNNINHLGTMGTGNHFLELCLDEESRVWVMLHSGSRGIGNRIGMHFISLAKKDMERWFISLPDKDLSYLAEGSEHFSDYVEAVSWAQKFASLNRDIMMKNALRALSEFDGIPEFTREQEVVNCHHNYINKERHFGKNVWVTRKGAVSAQEGEMGIIPGSMGQRSFIVRGKGNRDSFCSCSHGAGRAMSRTQAKRQFTIEDLVKQTEGVECKKDASVLDEVPNAYKDLDAVMAAQFSLVEVMHTLKQVICVKG